MPSGQEVELPSFVGIEAPIIVGFDATASSVAERSWLLEQLVTSIAPLAIDLRATVLVLAINERSATDVEVLGSGTFDFGTDNPNVLEDEGPTAAQALLDEVAGSLAGLLPSETSDPFGFLRIAGQLLERAEQPGRIVLLSDAVSTIETCSAPVLFGGGALGHDLAAVADDCVRGEFPNLDGVVVEVIAGGVDRDGELSDEVAQGSHALLTEVVLRSHGELVWTPVALGAAE